MLPFPVRFCYMQHKQQCRYRTKKDDPIPDILGLRERETKSTKHRNIRCDAKRTFGDEQKAEARKAPADDSPFAPLMY